MSKRKQSKEDRIKRIEDGRCPVHGCGMSPLYGSEYCRLEVCDHCGHGQFKIQYAKCMRKNCGIMAYVLDNFKLKLTADYEYLIDDSISSH